MSRTPHLIAHELIATHGSAAPQLLVDRIMAAARRQDDAEFALLGQALDLVKEHYALNGPQAAVETVGGTGAGAAGVETVPRDDPIWNV
jgi:hypothetical protein